MTMMNSVALRNAKLSAEVTHMGGGVIGEFRTGARPASQGAATGTLLATITYGATAVTDANGGTAGGVSAGVLTFGGFTQTNSSHVNGTPGYLRLKTPGGTVLKDIDVAASGTSAIVGFSGTVVNGQNITGTLTITEGNAGP